jgi:Peroxisomal membrane protein (Pex16)
MAPASPLALGREMAAKRISELSQLSIPTSTQELVDRSRELWEQYLDRVREYRPVLLQVDEYLGHLAFLLPSYGESGSGWIEVMFGLLQLSRLSVDLAESKRDANPFGASVAALPKDFPATASRISLTVLQCIWPVAQELVRSSRSAKITHRRQARVRCILERVRFLLRGVLLYQYWKHMKKEQQTPGLMLDGGQYLGEKVDHDHPKFAVPDVEQERARVRRAQYKGRRTGRKVGGEAGQRRLKGDAAVHEEEDDVAISPDAAASAPSPSTSNQALKSLFPEALRPYVNASTGIMAGELLYIARPLLQAEAHARTSNSLLLFKVWALCLSMDVASLVSLKESLRDVDGRDREVSKDSNVYLDAVKDMMGPSVDGNAVTQAEWKRRERERRAGSDPVVRWSHAELFVGLALLLEALSRRGGLEEVHIPIHRI